eukprot:TRINITY_DN32478_c0_g1_i1.p3 TRINITY_DN32478_c0_g1~~TRINITY_DN32478_c0_g1_i1.p3  ORF type:complete len:125 (-),score=17.66 TRINITY_DN32478_c0_g1_i1:144-518(-)
MPSLVGSEMCIRDRVSTQSTWVNLSRAEGIFLGNYYAFESCPFLFNYIDPNKSISIKVNGYTDSLNKFSFSSLFYNMHTIWETPHTFKILYQLNGKMYVGCFLKKNGLQINRVLIPEFLSLIHI